MKIWIAQIISVAHVCSSSRNIFGILPSLDNADVIGELYGDETAGIPNNGTLGANTPSAIQSDVINLAVNDQYQGFQQKQNIQLAVDDPRQLVAEKEWKKPLSYNSLQRKSLEPPPKAIRPEEFIRALAIRMFDTVLGDMSFDDKWARLRKFSKRSEVLARIHKDAKKLGLSDEDLFCVSEALGLPDEKCEISDFFVTKENQPLVAYWRLLRCLNAFLYPNKFVRSVRLNELAFIFGNLLSQNANQDEWSTLELSPYLKSEARVLMSHMDKLHGAGYDYDKNDYETLIFKGHTVHSEKRKEMVKKIFEILTILKEDDEGLGLRYQKKFDENFKINNNLLACYCVGFSVERHDVSAKAIVVFSLNYLPEAKQLVYAFGDLPGVPPEITDSLRDAIIFASLDWTFSKNIAPYCHILNHQTEFQKISLDLRMSKTPKERLNAIVTLARNALGANVDALRRKRILNIIDPALEDLRTVVEKYRKTSKINGQDAHDILACLEFEFNCTDSHRASSMLESLLPDIIQQINTIVESRDPKDYEARKNQIRALVKKSNDTVTKEMKSELLGDGTRLIGKLQESVYWWPGAYRQIRFLASTANNLANKTTGLVHKIFEDIASSLSSYAAAAGWMDDEIKTLDYIWNSVDSIKGHVPSNTSDVRDEKKLKGYFHAIILCTTSGANEYVLKKFMYQHYHHFTDFVAFTAHSTRFSELGVTYRNKSFTDLSWDDTGRELANRFYSVYYTRPLPYDPPTRKIILENKFEERSKWKTPSPDPSRLRKPSQSTPKTASPTAPKTPSPDLTMPVREMFNVSMMDIPFGDKWDKLQKFNKRGEVLAWIRKDANKLGLSQDDYRCVGDSLGIPEQSCRGENSPLLAYWRLLRCLNAFLSPNKFLRSVRLNELSFVFGKLFSENANRNEWFLLGNSPYFWAEANVLRFYLSKLQQVGYDYNLKDYDNLVLGYNIRSDKRTALAKKISEISTILEEDDEGLGLRYQKKFDEKFELKKNLLGCYCAGLSVERHNVSAKAVRVFSLNYLPEAKQVLLAFGSFPEIPRNITESLRDAILSVSLDWKFADNIAPFCDVLDNQTEFQKIETSLRMSKTPKERSKSTVMLARHALGVDVDSSMRNKILELIDPALEDLRTVVAKYKGSPKIEEEDVDNILECLSLETTNYREDRNRAYDVLGLLLPDIIQKINTIIDSRDSNAYQLKKDRIRPLVSRFIEVILSREMKPELLGDAKSLLAGMMESTEWSPDDYKRIRSLATLANKLTRKTTEHIQKYFKEVASALSSYAAAAGWMADELKTLDYIWNSVDIVKGRVPNINFAKDEKLMKGFFHSFVLCTTSGANQYVLNEYFRQHHYLIPTFVSLMKQSKRIGSEIIGHGSRSNKGKRREFGKYLEAGKYLAQHFSPIYRDMTLLPYYPFFE